MLSAAVLLQIYAACKLLPYGSTNNEAEYNGLIAALQVCGGWWLCCRATAADLAINMPWQPKVTNGLCANYISYVCMHVYATMMMMMF